MSMSAGTRKDGVRADINVTPFADIMIVLLIIFMVATTAIHQDHRLRLPAAASARESQESPLIVKVTRDGRMLLGETPLPDADVLQMALQARLGEGDSRLVQLQADEGLEYERVAAALAAVRAAGATQIVLRTQPGVQTTRNP
jgi:biopolymer transport protein ExbD